MVHPINLFPESLTQQQNGVATDKHVKQVANCGYAEVPGDHKKNKQSHQHKYAGKLNKHKCVHRHTFRIPPSHNN